ncbi:MAG TPA: cytochrome c oxidase assembly protein [Acidimicrobiia bacterium]|nr:cytochrome c oxidase assembly protein [Acidimicrobiia bacterium]
MLDVLLVAAAVGVVSTYARGWARTPPSALAARPVRVLAFGTGFAVTVVALAPPLEAVAETSLTAHMAQHVLLLAVAPPLLVAGRPGSVLARGLPLVAGPARRAWRGLRAATRRAGVAVPAAAVALQVTLMAAWHVPAVFDAAVRRPALHGLEHTTFLAASILLWWAVAGAAARGRPAVALLCVFTAGLACTALGALLVLASSPWYPAYAHRDMSAALADQQLAGIVMWGFANVALAVAAAVLVGTWLSGLEHVVPSRLRPRSVP